MPACWAATAATRAGGMLALIAFNSIRFRDACPNLFDVTSSLFASAYRPAVSFHAVPGPLTVPKCPAVIGGGGDAAHVAAAAGRRACGLGCGLRRRGLRVHVGERRPIPAGAHVSRVFDTLVEQAGLP